jgi:hypothetical protein
MVIECKHSVAEDAGEYPLRNVAELPSTAAIGQQGYAKPTFGGQQSARRAASSMERS